MWLRRKKEDFLVEKEMGFLEEYGFPGRIWVSWKNMGFLEEYGFLEGGWLPGRSKFPGRRLVSWKE